jgi:hypothetical protein
MMVIGLNPSFRMRVTALQFTHIVQMSWLICNGSRDGTVEMSLFRLSSSQSLMED